MIACQDFVDQLVAAVPEASPVVAEHLDDNGELLTDRLLAFLDLCLREGDEDVVNAVAVSFVEDFGVYPGETDGLLDRWPLALRHELGR